MHEAILIVDGSRETRELAERVLRNERYEVDVAGDAEQAFERLSSFRPRLILADMRLPGRVSALEMVRRMRSDPALRSIPIVMVTTDASEAEAVAAMAAGCDEFISQPLSTMTLRRLVAGWTGKDPGVGRLSPTGSTWMSRLFEPSRRRRTIVPIPNYRA